MEKPPRAFSSQNLERFARIFAQYHVEYLIIGKSGAIVYGFPDTTQDLDIFPEKTQENCRELISALQGTRFSSGSKIGGGDPPGQRLYSASGRAF